MDDAGLIVSGSVVFVHIFKNTKIKGAG